MPSSSVPQPNAVAKPELYVGQRAIRKARVSLCGPAIGHAATVCEPMHRATFLRPVAPGRAVGVAQLRLVRYHDWQLANRRMIMARIPLARSLASSLLCYSSIVTQPGVNWHTSIEPVTVGGDSAVSADAFWGYHPSIILSAAACTWCTCAV